MSHVALFHRGVGGSQAENRSGRRAPAQPRDRAQQRSALEELIRRHLRGGEIEVSLDDGQLAYRPAGELEAGRKLARRPDGPLFSLK